MDVHAKLSPHFTFGEMTITTNGRYLDENRRVPAALIGAGQALCQTLLEPIRDHFKQPVWIHSAYRCPALNAAVGGSKTSQHPKFEAADFHVGDVPFEDVWNWIWKDSKLPFGQAILEGWSAGHPSWIHLSLGAPYRGQVKSGQAMTFDGQKYVHVGRASWM